MPSPGEGMDVCKYIVPLWHGGTLISRQAISPFVRLVEREERWKTPDPPRVFSLKIWVKPSKIVLSPAWCSNLRTTKGLKT
ncbi:hypothetical protein TNCV_1596871 [Trichonephila clavipes]|nr:hypothetical protein TNCV_1596871 [Trichonephila clavipes]